MSPLAYIYINTFTSTFTFTHLFPTSHTHIALHIPSDPNLKAYKKQVGAIMVKGASRISAGKRIRLTSEDNQSDLYVTAYYSEDDLLVCVLYV
jgi:hypothetical protein